jgi:hypothetical protein
MSDVPFICSTSSSRGVSWAAAATGKQAKVKRDTNRAAIVLTLHLLRASTESSTAGRVLRTFSSERPAGPLLASLMYVHGEEEAVTGY